MGHALSLHIAWTPCALGYTIATASWKLNGRRQSEGSSAYIANMLSRHGDDLVVYFEMDTTFTSFNWARIADNLRLRRYTCNIGKGRSPAVPYSGLSSKGPKHGLHALLLCSKSSGSAPSVESPVSSCCHARGRPNKVVLFQSVRLTINGKAAVVMIIGVNFDTHDEHKAEQVDQLFREIRRQQAVASRDGHVFQAILLGDINDRIVLKSDARLDVEISHMRHWVHSQKVAALTNRSQAILRHLLVTNHGRRELLTWDVKYFDGQAVGGVTVEHPSRKFCDSFYLQTDWWREHQLEPSPVTYKYTPWDQLVSSDIVDDIARASTDDSDKLNASDSGWAVSFTELERALRAKGRTVKSLDPTSMPSFFMMTDHIPKTKLQVEDAQTYLNLDRRKDPVYLAFGWLDSVGFLRPKSVGDFGFDMPVFLDFTTDFGVRGDDHALTHARLQLTAGGADAKCLPIWSLLGGDRKSVV